MDRVSTEKKPSAVKSRGSNSTHKQKNEALILELNKDFQGVLENTEGQTALKHAHAKFQTGTDTSQTIANDNLE